MSTELRWRRFAHRGPTWFGVRGVLIRLGRRRNMGIWVKCECLEAGVSKHVMGVERASSARSNWRVSHTRHEQRRRGEAGVFVQARMGLHMGGKAAVNTWDMSMPGAHFKAK